MLDQEAGFAIVILALAVTALGLPVLRGGGATSSLAPLGHWGRLPTALALTSLAGLPLTTGFAVRLLLFSTSARAHLWGVYALVMVASATYCMLHWRRFRAAREAWKQGLGALHGEVGTQPLLQIIEAVGALAVSLALFVVGLRPGVIESFWSFPFPIALPTWSGILGGTSLLASMLLASALPVGLGYLLLSGAERLAARADAFSHRLGAAGRLDWLYGPIEDTLTTLRDLWRRAQTILEEPLALGWTFLWCAAIVLYLVER
jgi:hypothetical protein